MAPGGYADQLAVPILVCLGATYGDREPTGSSGDVGEVKGGQFTRTQSRRVSQQQEGAVAVRPR